MTGPPPGFPRTGLAARAFSLDGCVLSLAGLHPPDAFAGNFVTLVGVIKTQKCLISAGSRFGMVAVNGLAPCPRELANLDWRLVRSFFL
jgi:hypothetical protein